MRWKPLAAVRSEMNVASLEAQVLWGKSARDTFFEVSSVTQKLWAAVIMDMEVSAREMSEAYADGMERKRILWNMGEPPEKDQFMVELNAAIAKIEGIAKPHLVSG